MSGVLDQLFVHERIVELALMRSSFYDFFQQAWNVIEPATDLVLGWHIEALCEHLQAVIDGAIKKLIIAVPPGSTKSVTASVCLPAWAWSKRPDLRFLYSSHDQRLSTRDSVKCRRLIDSPWYRERWGGMFQLTGDQNVKTQYENTASGFRLALSTGSGATGHRGDVLVVDDAHSVREVESDNQRQAVLNWFDHEWHNRVNDYEKSAHIIIGQRTHVEDLIEHAARSGDWDILCIPEEFEPDRRCKTSIGWTDPRKREGDLLRPERLSREAVEKEKARLGSRAYAAQHQQRPFPAAGAMFKREWFTDSGGLKCFVDAVPEHAEWVRSWDKAATAGGGAFSCGIKIARADGLYYFVDVKRGQWSVGQRNGIMKQMAQLDVQQHGLPLTIIFEKEGGSGGVESAEFTIKDLAGYSVYAVPATGSKEVRAQPLAAQAEAGNIRIVRGPWNEAFIDELCAFPFGKFKDQVDAASHGFNWLATKPEPIAEFVPELLVGGYGGPRSPGR